MEHAEPEVVVATEPPIARDGSVVIRNQPAPVIEEKMISKPMATAVAVAA
jgi:hypothetical protein